MKSKKILNSFASWLENSENELLKSAETDTEIIVLAEALVNCSKQVKIACEKLSLADTAGLPVEQKRSWDIAEGPDARNVEAFIFGQFLPAWMQAKTEQGYWVQIDPEGPYRLVQEIREVPADTTQMKDEVLNVDDFAAMATELDAAGFHKEASGIDEILMILAADPSKIKSNKLSTDKKIDELAKKFLDIKSEMRKLHNIEAVEKGIEKSEFMKPVDVSAYPMSTRYDPNMVGVGLARISDGVYQSEADKKIYDYSAGYKMDNGDSVPGADISLQSKIEVPMEMPIYDTREDRTKA